jgi:hypothetical protein
MPLDLSESGCRQTYIGLAHRACVYREREQRRSSAYCTVRTTIIVRPYLKQTLSV